MDDSLSCAIHHFNIRRQRGQSQCSVEHIRLYQRVDGNTEPPFPTPPEWHHRARDEKILVAKQVGPQDVILKSVEIMGKDIAEIICHRFQIFPDFRLPCLPNVLWR